jgi:predicted SprT family Zn-dependent metalloprotease
MIQVECDGRVAELANKYAQLLKLSLDDLMLTTSRAVYGEWLGRRVPSSYGGAYCYLGKRQKHAILINLERIDDTQPKAIELVVAEELIHMRDRLDGDLRRHSHHGHDRIAFRVAKLTGATMDEVRSALIPVARRAVKYLYQCPGCGLTVPRKRKGTWSCGRCSPRFDRRFQMRIVQEFAADAKTQQ